MVSEAIVRHVIGVEGAEALISIINGAWQAYANEDITRFHRSTRAAVVWDYMAKRSDEILTEMDGVARTVRLDRPMYVLRDRIMLRLKMHSRDSTTRNYPTGAQREAMLSGTFPEYDYQIVSFGYRLDTAEAGIQDYVVTSPSDAWIINAEEVADGELSPVRSMLPGMDEDLTGIEPIRRKRSG